MIVVTAVANDTTTGCRSNLCNFITPVSYQQQSKVHAVGASKLHDWSTDALPAFWNLTTEVIILTGLHQTLIDCR